MPSISDVDIEYKHSIKIIQEQNLQAVGIDDAECKWSNENYTLAGFGGATAILFIS